MRGKRCYVIEIIWTEYYGTIYWTAVVGKKSLCAKWKGITVMVLALLRQQVWYFSFMVGRDI